MGKRNVLSQSEFFDRLDYLTEKADDTDLSIASESLEIFRDFMVSSTDLYQVLGKGWRDLAGDINFLIPAVTGVPSHVFRSEENIRSYINQEKKENKKHYEELRAITRLHLLLTTHNWINVDLESLQPAPEVNVSTSGIIQSQMTIQHLVYSALTSIMLPPIQARTAIFESGKLQIIADKKQSNEIYRNLKDSLEKGNSVSSNVINNEFISLISDHDYLLPSRNLVVHPSLKIMTNGLNIRKYNLTDPELMQILKIRYKASTILCAHIMKEVGHAQEEKGLINFINNLKNEGVDPEFVQGIQNFLEAKQDFVFNDETIDWYEKDRQGMYVGHKPKNKNIAPNNKTFAEDIETAQERPIIILIDVSGSMSGSINLAIALAERLAKEAVGHPVQFVIFSHLAGVLHQGDPILIKKDTDFTDLNVLKEIFEKFPNDVGMIAGATSLGNAINFGRSLGKNIASNMKKFKNKDGIVAHSVIISDNFHNTKPDIAETGVNGYYLKEQRSSNLPWYSAKKGVSTHNCIPTRANSLFDLFTLQAKNYIVEQVLSKQANMESRKFSHKLKALPITIAGANDSTKGTYIVLPNVPQSRILYNSKFAKVDFLSDEGRMLACWYFYTCQKVQEDAYFASSLETFLKNSLYLDINDFFPAVEYQGKKAVHYARIQDIYNELRKPEQINFNELDTDKIDADPFDTFDVARIIGEAQSSIHDHPVIPIPHKGSDQSLHDTRSLDDTVSKIMDQINSFKGPVLH